MQKSYEMIPGFANVYLEDSFVTNILQVQDTITYNLDVVLTEQHHEYHPPRDGEYYCYYPASIVFPRVEKVNWIINRFDGFLDSSQQKDYGNIDIFYYDDDGAFYHLEGDWGSVDIWSETPTISINSG